MNFLNKDDIRIVIVKKGKMKTMISLFLLGTQRKKVSLSFEFSLNNWICTNKFFFSFS